MFNRIKKFISNIISKINIADGTFLKIRSRSLADRCAICHQTALFNPSTRFCSHCARITIKATSVKFKTYLKIRLIAYLMPILVGSLSITLLIYILFKKELFNKIAQ